MRTRPSSSKAGKQTQEEVTPTKGVSTSDEFPLIASSFLAVFSCPKKRGFRQLSQLKLEGGGLLYLSVYWFGRTFIYPICHSLAT